MSAFGLTPKVPTPMTGAPFPTGIQFQENEVDVGPPNPQNVSFNNDFALTYDATTGTVNVESTASGGSGGSGGLPAAVGARASLTDDQQSGTTVIFNKVSGQGDWSDGNMDTALGVYTVPAGSDGYIFAIEAGLNLQSGSEGSASADVSIIVNGTNQIGRDSVTLGPSSDTQLKLIAGHVQLNAGDQISVQRTNGSWGTAIFVVGGVEYTFLSVVRLFPGP